jgi:hypothetical protein
MNLNKINIDEKKECFIICKECSEFTEKIVSAKNKEPKSISDFLLRNAYITCFNTPRCINTVDPDGFIKHRHENCKDTCIVVFTSEDKTE